MSEWLIETLQISEGLAQGLQIVFALIFVLALSMAAVFVIQRVRGNGFAINNRQARLTVQDMAPVDARRRLVLVRRDNVEHLVMIGGPTDIVIESQIVCRLPVSRQAHSIPVQMPVQTAPAATDWPKTDPEEVPKGDATGAVSALARPEAAAISLAATTGPDPDALAPPSREPASAELIALRPTLETTQTNRSMALDQMDKPAVVAESRSTVPLDVEAPRLPAAFSTAVTSEVEVASAKQKTPGSRAIAGFANSAMGRLSRAGKLVSDRAGTVLTRARPDPMRKTDQSNASDAPAVAATGIGAPAAVTPTPAACEAALVLQADALLVPTEPKISEPTLPAAPPFTSPVEETGAKLPATTEPGLDGAAMTPQVERRKINTVNPPNLLAKVPDNPEPRSVNVNSDIVPEVRSKGVSGAEDGEQSRRGWSSFNSWFKRGEMEPKADKAAADDTGANAVAPADGEQQSTGSKLAVAPEPITAPEPSEPAARPKAAKEVPSEDDLGALLATELTALNRFPAPQAAPEIEAPDPTRTAAVEAPSPAPARSTTLSRSDWRRERINATAKAITGAVGLSKSEQKVEASVSDPKPAKPEENDLDAIEDVLSEGFRLSIPRPTPADTASLEPPVVANENASDSAAETKQDADPAPSSKASDEIAVDLKLLEASPEPQTVPEPPVEATPVPEAPAASTAPQPTVEEDDGPEANVPPEAPVAPSDDEAPSTRDKAAASDTETAAVVEAPDPKDPEVKPGDDKKQQTPNDMVEDELSRLLRELASDSR